MSRLMKCSYSGKSVFWSEKIAKHALRKTGNKRLATYRCASCGYFHFYTKKKREKPDVRLSN